MAQERKRRKKRRKRVIVKWTGPSSKYLSESKDKKGRVIVWLGLGHPYANSGGWQYKARFLVMENLGKRLARDEHVHHINGIIDDDRLENYEILLEEEHGRFHGRTTVLMQYRCELGKFLEIEEIERDRFDDLEYIVNESDNMEDIPF